MTASMTRKAVALVLIGPFHESPMLSREHFLSNVESSPISLKGEPPKRGGMNHQPAIAAAESPGPKEAAAAAAPPPLRSSLRSLPSLRRSLRSLSRGRLKSAGKASRWDDEGEGGDDYNDENANKVDRLQQCGLSEPEGPPSKALENRGKSSSSIRRSADAKKPSPAGDNQAARRYEEKETERSVKKPSPKAGREKAGERGRSRSRVRALLSVTRRGSNDGTAPTNGSEAPDDASASPNARHDDRGRSQSRLRRLFLGRSDRSKSRTRTDSVNTADPLGLQACRDRERDIGASGGAAGADAAVRQSEFARFRSAVVETIPSDSSGRGVARNESGQLSELSSIQHPPTDLLPIQSGVLAVTAASRLLMRSVSLLGMEDPVLRRDGPVDVDMVVVENDTAEHDGASAREEMTATSEDGGGFDRRQFDELLLVEASVNAWIRAVNNAASPSSNEEGHSGDGAREGTRRRSEIRQSAGMKASKAIGNDIALDARPTIGALVDESPAHSTLPELASSSSPPSNMPLPPKLDSSRSTRALKSLLEHQPSPAKRAPSASSHQPLSRSEVDTVLAALAHSQKKHVQGRRRNRRRSLDDGMVEPGFEQAGVSDEGDGAIREANALRRSLVDPLLSATSTHSLQLTNGGGFGSSSSRAPQDRVVVKVRVKRRSTLHCAPPIGGGGGSGGGGVGGLDSRNHHHASWDAAPTKMFLVSPPAASVASTAPPPSAHAKAGRDPPDPALLSTTAVQELMSRPRRLPDTMDSVFA
jgi:hypothetical protein